MNNWNIVKHELVWIFESLGFMINNNNNKTHNLALKTEEKRTTALFQHEIE